MTTPNTGAIFDLGYQNYSGARLGRAYAFKSLVIQSLRTVFGIGRPARAKMMPVSLFVAATIPALIASTVAAATNNMLQLTPHERYFATTAWYFALFCASQAPELFCGDQQYRVLSLYFTRALKRSDYVFARILALVIALFFIGFIPQLILFLGRSFVNEYPWSAVVKEAHLLPPILASSVLIALLFASVAMLMASSTHRRLLATVAIMSMFMITMATASVMVRLNADSLRYMLFTSPMLLSEGVSAFLFGKPPVPRGPVASAAIPGWLLIGASLAITTVAIWLTNFRYKRIPT